MGAAASELASLGRRKATAGGSPTAGPCLASPTVSPTSRLPPCLKWTTDATTSLHFTGAGNSHGVLYNAPPTDIPVNTNGLQAGYAASNGMMTGAWALAARVLILLGESCCRS